MLYTVDLIITYLQILIHTLLLDELIETYTVFYLCLCFFLINKF